MQAADDDGVGEPVVISALEHWSYCPRQCGLIHLEQTFDENYYTIKGQLLHARADSGVSSDERGQRILRDIVVWSRRLGLVGRVDQLETREGVPYPVEFKSGSQRTWRHEAVQLCAQALCLEEMLGVPVPAGAVSYLASRRRREVVFDEALKRAVPEFAQGIREMLGSGILPPAVNDLRCRRCSLLDSCIPEALANKARLVRWGKALFTPIDPLD